MDDHCKELMQKFSEYIDGEMCDEECQEILEHLKECDCCSHCMETLEHTRNFLNNMPKPDMPADLKDRLKACLREPKKTK